MGVQCLPAKQQQQYQILVKLTKEFPGRAQDIQKIPAEFNYHNNKRFQHGVQPLQVNFQLCVMAMKWAQSLKQKQQLSFSGLKFKDSEIGQNVVYEEKRLFSEVWYAEESKYNYQAENGAEAGHFTQMVWRDSRQVGIGVSGNFCAVMYYPAGNFEGRFKENVPKRRQIK